jgi:hypothetical protein
VIAWFALAVAFACLTFDVLLAIVALALYRKAKPIMTMFTPRPSNTASTSGMNEVSVKGTALPPS